MGSFEGGNLRIIGRVVVGTFGYGLLAASMAVLYLGMRAVMDVGGRCATGNQPFVIAQECPDNVAEVMTASIFAGLLGLALGATSFASLPGPRLWMFAWTGLFGSLGWNFLDYGVNPPEAMGIDREWGFILCGVMFWLMAAGPLLMLFSRDIARKMLWADAGEARRPSQPTVRASTIAQRNPNARLGGRPASDILGTTGPAAHHGAPPGTHAATPGAGVWTTSSTVAGANGGAGIRSDARGGAGTPGDTTVATSSDPGSSLAAELERLAQLHRSGALTDAEFRAAKGHLLDGSN